MYNDNGSFGVKGFLLPQELLNNNDGSVRWNVSDHGHHHLQMKKGEYLPTVLLLHFNNGRSGGGPPICLSVLNHHIASYCMHSAVAAIVVWDWKYHGGTMTIEKTSYLDTLRPSDRIICLIWYLLSLERYFSCWAMIDDMVQGRPNGYKCNITLNHYVHFEPLSPLILIPLLFWFISTKFRRN